MKMKKALSIIFISLIPTVASAHITPDMGGGFVAGIKHPVIGIDHLLAMLSVGILSTQLGGRAIWLLPTTFVLVMACGGIIGIEGIEIIGVETGIAFSVIALGAMIALGNKKIPVLLIYLLVAFFATSHGYAHGSEMPKQVDPTMFALGFMIATATIHIAGISIGLFSTRILHAAEYLRLFGATIAGVGFHILVE